MIHVCARSCHAQRSHCHCRRCDKKVTYHMIVTLQRHRYTFVRVCHSPRVVWTAVVIDEKSVLQVLHIASLAHLELQPGSAELQRMVSDVREILRFTRQ